MSRQNITEKIWYDSEVKNSIMLDVTEDVPEQKSRIINGVTLHPKDEYHCTLVPVGKLSENPAKITRIIEDVTDYLRFNPDAVRFIGLADSFYVCNDEAEVTLIAEATIVGLNRLRKIVQQTIPEFKPVLPHATLLKSESSQYGIGIYSTMDLKKMCKKVDLSAL